MKHHPATIRQCAILVGGLGTRLGDATAATPKPILTCGDRPFLAWLLREFLRFGVEEFVLLTGHLSERIQDALPAIAATLPKQVRITCCVDPIRAGTGGALLHAREHLDPRFLLCNGDSLLDFNFARLLADATCDGPEVLGRMVLRQMADASRYGVVETDADRVLAFHERPAPGQPGAINAGVYLFNREILDHLAPACSLERDILPVLAASGRIRATAGAGYFIDIGVPADLARAQSELPARLHRPALFLDRDGVINVDHGWTGTRDRFEWVPGARQAIRAAADAGMHVFIVTNQSGIARGYYSEDDFHALTRWMIDGIRGCGGTIDDFRHCPFHPDATVEAYRRTSDRRKPAPGMIVDLLRAWQLDPAICVLIGDQPSDLAAAAAAGVAGHLFPGGNLADFVRPLLRA
jgi:D,D-heptose 1,7-bisphosphate phosphatase